ncbi:MAG: inverse autotransporter beta domain-containing protein, partial [Rhodospirillaceae bacterium]
METTKPAGNRPARALSRASTFGSALALALGCAGALSFASVVWAQQSNGAGVPETGALQAGDTSSPRPVQPGAETGAGYSTNDPTVLLAKGLDYGGNAVAAGTTEILGRYLPTIEFDLRFSDNYEILGQALILAPIWESADSDHMVFTQGSISHFSGRTTGNIGLGYRHLAFEDKLLAGVNAFYDYEWPYDHQRGSIGAELRTSVAEINSNVYFGISGWQDGEKANTQERAMGGWDIELAAPLPYLPRTRLSGTYFEWNAQTGGFSENGQTLALEAELYAGVTAQIGRR